MARTNSVPPPVTMKMVNERCRSSSRSSSIGAYTVRLAGSPRVRCWARAMNSRARAANSSGGMPANRSASASPTRSRPISATAARSLLNNAAYSGLWASDGSLARADFRASMKKSNWTYVGRSHHKVPSLSNAATRWSTGRASEAARKFRTDSRVSPSCQDGSGRAVEVKFLGPSNLGWLVSG